ncbi:hypothetical protein EDB80DRAFT_841991 [Ilyonectria destructans]|nr:hypothetical protein EDB80DRAFT_841991 [Ilyonectria destructans]
MFFCLSIGIMAATVFEVCREFLYEEYDLSLCDIQLTAQEIAEECWSSWLPSWFSLLTQLPATCCVTQPVSPVTSRMTFIIREIFASMTCDIGFTQSENMSNQYDRHKQNHCFGTSRKTIPTTVVLNHAASAITMCPHSLMAIAVRMILLKFVDTIKPKIIADYTLNMLFGGIRIIEVVAQGNNDDRFLRLSGDIPSLQKYEWGVLSHWGLELVKLRQFHDNVTSLEELSTVTSIPRSHILRVVP